MLGFQVRYKAMDNSYLSRIYLFFIVSVSLHGGFFILLPTFSKSLKPEIVTIYVEYKKAGERLQVPQLQKAIFSANQKTAKAQLMPNNSISNKAREGGDSLTVLGADLGIQASYPRLSRILGEKGRVLVEIKKDVSGAIGLPTVSASSGYLRLDQAALLAARGALKSGLLSRYLETQDQMQISFIFKLSARSGLTE